MTISRLLIAIVGSATLIALAMSIVVLNKTPAITPSRTIAGTSYTFGDIDAQLNRIAVSNDRQTAYSIVPQPNTSGIAAFSQVDGTATVLTSGSPLDTNPLLDSLRNRLYFERDNGGSRQIWQLSLKDGVAAAVTRGNYYYQLSDFAEKSGDLILNRSEYGSSGIQSSLWLFKNSVPSLVYLGTHAYFSVDGRYIVASRMSGRKNDVVIVSVDSLKEQQTGLHGIAVPSPALSRIAVMVPGSGRWGIYTRNERQGEIQRQMMLPKEVTGEIVFLSEDVVLFHVSNTICRLDLSSNDVERPSPSIQMGSYRFFRFVRLPDHGVVAIFKDTNEVESARAILTDRNGTIQELRLHVQRRRELESRYVGIFAEESQKVLEERQKKESHKVSKE